MTIIRQKGSIMYVSVSIYSRKQIEKIIADNKFPPNQVVISFYDSVIPVDYSGVCDTVFYSKIADLDLEVLKNHGMTYDTYFPEADALAEFIVQAYMKRQNIICQCEYGQSRSAACAAAILEYFSQKGISIFTDYQYYPNQVVYHKVYDALVKRNSAYALGGYLHKELEKIPHFKFPKLPQQLDYNTGAATLYSVKYIEEELTSLGLCHHSFEKAFDELCHGKAKVWVSLHIDNAKPCHGAQGQHFVGVRTEQKYHDKSIPLTVYFGEFKKHFQNKVYGFYGEKCEVFLRELGRRISFSFDILGLLTMEYKEPIMEKCFIITNIHYM